MYDISALYIAESLPQALELLASHPEAKIIAGGSDVLVQIREGSLAGVSLVSLHKLNELRGITLEDDGTLRIGALNSFTFIENHPLIAACIPVLGEAVGMVGGPQIRNIGTIGGNVSNGVTSADSASTLLAWDAVMEYSSLAGKRLVPISQHYISAGKTALEHNEILSAILIPKTSWENCAGHYIKYAMRNAMDIATLGVSVNVSVPADKSKIARCRIAFGVAGPVPMRAATAEALAKDAPISNELLTEISHAVLQDIKVRSSWRASAELRSHLAVEITERALRKSIELTGGQL